MHTDRCVTNVLCSKNESSQQLLNGIDRPTETALSDLREGDSLVQEGLNHASSGRFAQKMFIHNLASPGRKGESPRSNRLFRQHARPRGLPATAYPIWRYINWAHPVEQDLGHDRKAFRS